LHEEDLQALTRALCNKINTETAHEAVLNSQDEEISAKGTKILFGVILLKLLLDQNHLQLAIFVAALEEYERHGIQITLKNENGELYTLQELKEIVKNKDWQKIIKFMSNTSILRTVLKRHNPEVTKFLIR